MKRRKKGKKKGKREKKLKTLKQTIFIFIFFWKIFFSRIKSKRTTKQKNRLFFLVFILALNIKREPCADGEGLRSEWNIFGDCTVIETVVFNAFATCWRTCGRLIKKYLFNCYRWYSLTSFFLKCLFSTRLSLDCGCCGHSRLQREFIGDS